MRWRKVTLIGVGLLGGSLGMALRKHGFAGSVHGYVRRAASVDECLQAGAVDEATTDLQAAVLGADLIVFCTPLAQMGALARSILEGVSPGCLVTDVGSVKGEIVRDLEPLFRARNAVFIGSHPMAGSERMGVSAARWDLFQGAVCVVTPGGTSPAEMVEKTEKLWQGVGARTLRLSPETHDELVARSSHLPHVLAANLAGYVLDTTRIPEQAQLCATGFRDSTRIASGSPEMWRDIVEMNKVQLKQAVREFAGSLSQFEALLDRGDSAAIQEFFENAKRLRDAWVAKCNSQSGE